MKAVMAPKMMNAARSLVPIFRLRIDFILFIPFGRPRGSTSRGSLPLLTRHPQSHRREAPQPTLRKGRRHLHLFCMLDFPRSLSKGERVPSLPPEPPKSFPDLALLLIRPIPNAPSWRYCPEQSVPRCLRQTKLKDKRFSLTSVPVCSNSMGLDQYVVFDSEFSPVFSI